MKARGRRKSLGIELMQSQKYLTVKRIDWGRSKTVNLRPGEHISTSCVQFTVMIQALQYLTNRMRLIKKCAIFFFNYIKNWDIISDKLRYK